MRTHICDYRKFERDVCEYLMWDEVACAYRKVDNEDDDCDQAARHRVEGGKGNDAWRLWLCEDHYDLVVSD